MRDGAAAGALVVALAVWAGPAIAAVPAPLDTQAVRLELLSRRPASVRVTGVFGTRRVTAPWTDADGLYYRAERAVRPALFVVADLAPPALPNPIPWSSIQRIERPQFRIGPGPIVGGLLGGLAGAGVHYLVHRSANGDDWSVLFIFLGTVCGAATGAVATMGEHWVPVPTPVHR